MKGKGTSCLTFYARNTSQWAEESKRMVRSPPCGADVLGIIENHQPAGTELNELLDYWDQYGWKVVATPARRSKRSMDAGGTSMGCRRHWTSSSFRHLARFEDQTRGMTGLGSGAAFEAGPIDFWDFVAMELRAYAGPITLLTGYLTASIGLVHDNLTKLSSMGAFVNSLLGPWIMICDWNVEPGQLRASGWLQEVKGHIFTPEDTDFTSWAAGAMFDFAVAGGGAEAMIRRTYSDTSGTLRAHGHCSWDRP